MSKFNLWGVKALSAAAVLAPFALVANAQFPTGGPGPSNFTPPITTINQTTGFICFLLSWGFTFLIILAVVFVLVAAFKYLTAGGNTEKLSSAHHTLIYAAVAIVVALVAKGVPAIVGTLFNVTGLSSC